MSLLADLTHPDVDALNRDRTVAVVPVGAIEQHGPHLPFDTDAFLVTAVAQEAASRVSDDGPVLVTPTLPVGSSEHHMAFPGTLTLASDTFLRMVTEVCLSLHRHGFRRQVVINGHGGNTALLAEAVRQLAFEATAFIVAASYWDLARSPIEALRQGPHGGMGHACEFETSLMLHLRPDAVRQDSLGRWIPEPRLGGESFDLLDRGSVATPWRTDELSPSGVLGAPELASAEKGAQLFEGCVQGLMRLIRDLRRANRPNPGDRERE